MIRLICLLALILTGQVYAQSNECKACIQQKIDARWALRQQCLQAGGNEQSCNGTAFGATCCGCSKPPQEAPNCWQNACGMECWTLQCAEVCD